MGCNKSGVDALTMGQTWLRGSSSRKLGFSVSGTLSVMLLVYQNEVKYQLTLIAPIMLSSHGCVCKEE